VDDQGSVGRSASIELRVRRRRALGGRRFEIVYTGGGALNWLPDLERWAAVAAGLLEPSGTFHLVEFHPVTFAFADDDLTLEYDYFLKPEGIEIEDEGGSYADLKAKTLHNRTLEWQHRWATS